MDPTDPIPGLGSARETRGVARALAEMRGLTQGFAEELGAAATAMRGMDAEAKTLARSLGGSLRSALDKAIFGGAKLGDVLKGLAADVLGKTVDFALKPVQAALSGGLTSALGSLTGGLVSALGFARGGVVSGGVAAPVQAFARGGVVSGPTVFPMARGIGLMGEAGPEAILPLRRGADGRLGVSAEGRSASAPTVHITIQTPDIAGFRRSRGQVAAELARAVGRGSARL